MRRTSWTCGATRTTILLIAVGLALGAFAQGAGAKVVWLCQPGQRPDPCTPGLSTTVYSPTLRPLRVTHPQAMKPPKIDCFYVYPTVSDQQTVLANFHVDPEERSIALYQAARYSQYCRVFAPVYRQVTVLAKDNHGRGFVLLGHSQGSFLLRELIAKDVDPTPAVRRRLLSAILLGGNVLVKRGSGIGGDFKHIPACRSARQLGCVIAYSTFDQIPPNPSLFGRTPVKGDQVLCTNPAALAGGTAKVDLIFPSQPFAPGTLIATGITLLKLTQPAPPTVWASEPGAYGAHCSSANGAHVLAISPLAGAQVATPSPDPTWGLHLVDANIELGNLLTVVKSEAAAFTELG